MSERLTQTNRPIIGSNIKRLRTERNLRATDVIAKLQLKNIKVTTGIFSKVEHGRNNPTVEMLIALTEIFQCDFNEFFKE
jgi:transcriptional regulator with XRE-family HTH domain